ncbi:MAG TPA: hypothetical protein PKK30_17985, partial [Nitrospira sp.]|nr:hypothetical protein [Nitrospira sp.]
MSGAEKPSTDQLDFVTMDGLLAYGGSLARRVSSGRFQLPPPPPPPSTDRPERAQAALDRIRTFVQRTQSGLPSAEAYRAARQELLTEACGGDPVVFFAAWNLLLARGELAPLYRAPIGTTQKPTHRRPVAIVPRTQLTPQLAEGRIVLDLGDDRFWLLPRDLGDRTLFLTMRHGVSEVESKTHRVGRRLANVLDPARGVPRADAVGAALARMVGVVGQQLGYLQLRNYLDPRTFLHLISRSPNTEQLCRRITQALLPDRADAVHPHVESTLESQDFGWVTGMEKQAELDAAAQAFGVDTKTAKRLIKHPFYCYPGGHSFFDLYVDVIDGLHRLGRAHPGEVLCLYTHSSTLRALRIYLDPRPFREAFSEFGEYKEGQDNVVLLTLENGKLSGYSTAVGLIESDRVAREAWVTVERERSQRVTLKPGRIKRLLALVSGGDFGGGGAALKELRVTGNRFGLDVLFVRHGFLGLANNWIDAVTEEDTRGMSS